ncbi:UPF0052-domain-containing protein [Laetiporus sulphureus 93-53]|uniref:UPF0052-domain-containing protein n=1 Tax=Laetiporus sulphureus 93-53 TaxID=1314785 RepID=A0A165FH46_9APHY|nr:UPF0052-domain-containing protein [Laetiporus sulphureus 93-53]KZT08962.1 UPF0052-domain-containing protein [Laetiporus sulphureus 93-53]
MSYFNLVPDICNTSADSPGSSVFDLPTQPERNAEWATPSQQTIHGDAVKSTDSTACRLKGECQSPAGPSFLVISGGTGCNSICSAFGNACYVLPVSDDGGSSSEIIRVLGGPSIGDIRSRLVRLIPSAPTNSPLDRIRNLLAYRLPAHSSEREARDEWRDIVEGRSHLWQGIPNDRKEMIRGFLVHFESEVLKRAHKNFSFVNGSIGNYFLSAAQTFFRSLPSAIFLFSSITNSQANILPVIVTNHTVTIAAELDNGGRLVGQCDISHPVPSSTGTAPGIGVTTYEADYVFESQYDVAPPSPVDALDGVISPQRNVMFQADAKEHYEPLDARISRLYYINAYGSEIHPSPNPDYIANLSLNNVLVYSCGSLWTSVIPCLALKGVANAIACSRSLRAKVLLLNSRNDRETSGYTATDYIKTIARTLNTPYHSAYGGLRTSDTTCPISAYITHMLYLNGTPIDVDLEEVMALGVKPIEVEGCLDEKTGMPQFDAVCVRRAILEIMEVEARD